ncbi:hypothetical protein PRIPAC_92073 [Pristionchus pacificus]|uniref:DUF148 domain-containing protein n=1 Tax=Pristionchus pacificus TaxID=54126 RepID=A0A454XTG5_PRIPA|nr:hypothetical protein PRIPAC_92073 [Pristionchus pacificus]|eukprot:PDM74750.1 hypothetical protein PRIPAC_43701 [Pristionchus pacificus]
MLSRVSLVVLLGLAAIAAAGHSSEEYGGRREDRRGSARPWYWRRFFGRNHGGPGAPWFPPHGPHGGPHGGHHRRGPPFPPPPFLKDASDEARKEFFQIFENANQTKAQTKERIHDWASKQPQSVQDGVIAFERNLTVAREAMRENATAVILQLETALDRFSTVLEDENLTQRETMEKLRNTARSFDRDIVFAVKMIMRNARIRVGQKFFPRPERENGFPFGVPEGMPFPPPHGPMPPPPPPPPPPAMPFGPEGPVDPFFPPPPPPKGEENAEDMGIFLPGDF